ncbi:MAG: 2Fe-2S iron-sulfur cluster binding domain-containing protein, partial [Proteobacteria bacterium]|nr:2Fe-2S iron-sulfur cluster binding domain-containing protein [Pseudomonadota bacterium]
MAVQVNGRPVTFSLSPRTGLLDALRNGLGLTGTRFGCGQGQCGACAVRVDGMVEAACHLTLADVEGKSVETVEALSQSDPPHALIEAMLAVQAGQCG